MNAARRRLAPQERRDELLEAAMKVLRDHPPADVRVEDITRAAGTAKGNFYRYFATFDDLLVAVRDHILDRYGREVEARLAARTSIDWWDVLDDEIDAFFALMADLGGLHEAAFHGPAAERAPIADERGADVMIATLLQAGSDDDAFARVDVEPTARLLFHLLHGAADDIAAGAHRARTIDAACTMIRRTLAPS